MSSGNPVAPWYASQIQTTAALKAMRDAEQDGQPVRARQYLLVARSSVSDAVRLDARPLPEWVRALKDRGAS